MDPNFPNGDTGIRAIDDDHHTLARLLLRAGNVCREPPTPDRDCCRCAEDQLKACFESLTRFGSDILHLMLEHFHGEDVLMNSLPRNRYTKTHCDAHRLDHVNFSTRYNRTVSQFDAHRPAIGLLALNEFVVDWTGSHVLEHDTELGRLLKLMSPRR